ncbi:hypothetical protein AVEN_235225-1 [Araneus ventricosus]|uniref:Uncharacterized protein n=1 Tax=Araneus ventricosus TaxID=182803 RepID=A0A4Y2KBB9_ARAVE|nr:hypothetical protein AVEN_235225-1 [Araneus ventricosus]
MTMVTTEPLSQLPHHTSRGYLTRMDLACNRPTYTAVLRWHHLAFKPRPYHQDTRAPEKIMKHPAYGTKFSFKEKKRN